MKASKKFNMPVQGKSIPRHGSTANYDANVEASFDWGSVLNIAKKVGSALLS